MEVIEIEGHKVYGDKKAISTLENLLKNINAKLINQNDTTIMVNNKKIIGSREAVEKLESMLLKMGAKLS
jgi:hypothetical protein